VNIASSTVIMLMMHLKASTHYLTRHNATQHRQLIFFSILLNILFIGRLTDSTYTYQFSPADLFLLFGFLLIISFWLMQ